MLLGSFCAAEDKSESCTELYKGLPTASRSRPPEMSENCKKEAAFHSMATTRNSWETSKKLQLLLVHLVRANTKMAYQEECRAD